MQPERAVHDTSLNDAPDDNVTTGVDAGDLLAPVAEEMAAVEAILRREVIEADGALNAILRDASLLRGKGLRPGVVLLIAKACGRCTDEHALLAAAVELIHNATLIHDDVIDDAAARRNHATIHAAHGVESAVLLGDYVFTRAFVLANRLADREAVRELAETSSVVCRGEMLQVLRRFDPALDEPTYLRIVGDKTASLYATAGALGARLAGATADAVEAARTFGRSMGIAFQIIDDCLDLVGDEATMGKTLATDVDKGKLTLPVIRYLQGATADERAALLALLEGDLPRSDKRAAVLERLEHVGAVDDAYAIADAEITRARAALATLPPSTAREALEAMTVFVTRRRH